MWKKIQELGLSVFYIKDSETRNILKMPQSLAFLPIEDVISTFELLKKKIPEDQAIKDFFEYFEKYYIGEQVEIRPRGRNAASKPSTFIRKEPPFPVKLWNVNSRVDSLLPRTNNFVEAWHNSFSVCFFFVYFLFVVVYLYFINSPCLDRIHWFISL